MNAEAVLNERMQAYNTIAGPRKGDFVVLPGGGVITRLAIEHKEGFQTGTRGSFWLGSRINFSGTSDLGLADKDILESTRLEATGETLAGEVYVIGSQAVKSELMSADFRVFRLKD